VSSLAGGNPVDLFGLIAWIGVVLVAVTVIWPLNVPLLALACKVRQGTQPVGYEPREFWLRCTFGALGLAVMTLLLVGLTYGLIVEAELDQKSGANGVVHVVLLLIYVVAAMAYLFWMLALEDMLQALSVFLLYVFLPGVPLFLVGWLAGAGGWISENAPWML
jgi:hypothetical protein